MLDNENPVVYMDSIQVSEQSSVAQNSVPCDLVYQSSGLSSSALTKEIVGYEQESDETQVVKIDDCIVAYMKYVAEVGFVVRKSCQKRLRSRVVKQKCLVCNRKAQQQEVHKRFEDQERVVVQQVVMVQEKEDLVQDEKDLVQEEEEDLF
ncbi:hypothetical protein Tco_0205318 [Tanacetum coccineum]